MITNETLSTLRANVTELATTIGSTIETAFDAAALPEWIWNEMVAAQNAAGPAPEFSFNLLAPQSAVLLNFDQPGSSFQTSPHP